MGRTTLATDEIGVIGLLYRADWTRLALSAELGDGSTVELRDVNVAAAADFKVDIPVGLQVVEETTFAPRTRSRRPDQHTY